MDKTEISIGFSPHIDNWIAEVAINNDFAIELTAVNGSIFIVYHGAHGEPYQGRCSLDTLLAGIETAKGKLLSPDRS
jgi:hypothetical protein